MNGNIVMTQVSATKDKRRSARHKSQLVAEDENSIELKLNDVKAFYDNLAKGVVI